MQLENKYKKEVKTILENSLNLNYKVIKEFCPIKCKYWSFSGFGYGGHYSITYNIEGLNEYMFKNGYTHDQFNKVVDSIKEIPTEKDYIIKGDSAFMCLYRQKEREKEE
jgi:hypothetical protein